MVLHAKQGLVLSVSELLCGRNMYWWIMGIRVSTSNTKTQPIVQ